MAVSDAFQTVAARLDHRMLVVTAAASDPDGSDPDGSDPDVSEPFGSGLPPDAL